MLRKLLLGWVLMVASMAFTASAASAHGPRHHRVYRPVVPVYRTVYRPVYRTVHRPVYGTIYQSYRPYRVARPGISISIGTAPRYFGPAVRPYPAYGFGRPYVYSRGIYSRGIRIGF